MTQLTAWIAPFAGVALFILGLRQITAASMGRVAIRSFPTLRDRQGSGNARLRAGMRIASGGSAGAAASAVISFVDAGELPGPRSTQALAGVHLGSLLAAVLAASIGPAVSTLLPAFLMLLVALPARQYGAAGQSSRNDIITGTAFLLLGMDIAFHSGPELTQALPVNALPAFAISPVAAIAAGIAIAALFRSATGTTVLATALLATGMVPSTAAVLLALAGIPGAGIAFHLSTTRLSRRARVASMTFFLLGVLSGLFGLIAWGALNLVSAIPPVPGLVAVMLPVAAVFTGHVFSAVVALSAPALLHRLADRLVSEDPEASDTQSDADSLHLLKAPLPETLDANLAITRAALGNMAQTAYEMLMIVINISQLSDEADNAIERIIALRQANHTRGEQISSSLTRSAQLRCTNAQADEIRRQQQIAGELSLIGDDCYKASRMMVRSYRKNYTVHKQSADELFAYTSHILDFLRYISDTLGGRITPDDPTIAAEMEQNIDRQRDKLKKRARKALQKNPDADVKGELAFIDVVSYLEHVADRCNAIAELVR
ncbi:MAG: Na/Pi cotransporter family protein [Spirochaetaceae bacterium]|nr:MAG: Na/Pi cotransporter family protein [Spirochaetaceae bacterium]